MDYEDLASHVLQIARTKKGLIFYRDFYHLNPNPSNDRFLHQVKDILLSDGYICHEQRRKITWPCDYQGRYTHFHKEVQRTCNNAKWSASWIYPSTLKGNTEFKLQWFWTLWRRWESRAELLHKRIIFWPNGGRFNLTMQATSSENLCLKRKST